MDQTKYLPLYLKHRPQSLGDLVGQKSVVKTLTNAIENKRIAHAYLFTGPRGTGKTSSARILAKSLNCENGPTVTPCLECASCVSIKESSCPSVFEIDAASNNSVDDARMLIERAPLVAQGGRNKLYIVDECHMLTKEAFNALLKTIEEPPPNVIFILATTEEHKVPPTILSRCQRLMFRLVNHDELAEHLASVAQKENIEIQKDALELITRKSGGGLRDALGLLDQAALLARPGEPVSQKDLLVLLGALDEDVLLKLSNGILERNGKEVLDGITGLVMQGREPALIAQEMAKHFLNLTKASYVSKDSNPSDATRFILGSQTYIDGLIAQAALFERAELTQMVEQLDNLEQALKRATQPSMTLEIALLSLCHRHDIANVKELQQKLAQLEDMIGKGDFSNLQPKRPGGDPQPARPNYAAPAAPPRQEAPLPHRQEAPQAAPQPAPTQQPAPAPAQQPAPQAQSQILPQGDDEDEGAPDEGAPDVVVSSVQTLPPLIAGDDDDDESYGDADSPSYQPAPQMQSPPQQAAPPADDYQHSPGPAREPGTASYGAGDGELSHAKLEELWSDLLDALHKRSIPAYSLVSMHAFPVRFEAKVLTLGVQKEFFQKSIENKTTNIMTAYKDLTNDEIRVIVKVIDGGGQVKEAPKKQRASDGAAPMQQQKPAPDVAHRAQAEPPTARIPQEPTHVPNRTPASTATASRPAPAERDEEGERRTQPARTDAMSIISGSIDQSKIQEAYKIFEGPGSRLIG